MGLLMDGLGRLFTYVDIGGTLWKQFITTIETNGENSVQTPKYEVFQTKPSIVKRVVLVNNFHIKQFYAIGPCYMRFWKNGEHC